MNSITTKLEKSLKYLLIASEKPICIAIKGGWGEGKSYFWRGFVRKHKIAEAGYVSVFGAESIHDIREKILVEASPLEGNTNWAASIRGVMSKFAGKIGVPEAVTFNLMEKQLIQQGWILCLDDVERMSKNISVEEFMGLINQLKEQKGLKIVLIYNGEEIANDSVFESRREKVIDRELAFFPDFADCVRFAFGDSGVIESNPELLSDLERWCRILNLRNIRILVKVLNYVEESLTALPEKPDTEFMHHIFHSVMLFVWIKYADKAQESVDFDDLGQWSLLVDSASMRSPGESNDSFTERTRRFRLLEEYGYLHSDELDEFLINFVNTDILDEGTLRSLYDSASAESERTKKESRYRQVWLDQFHGSLQDNSAEFRDALVAAVLEYGSEIPANKLDEALVVLQDIGEREAADRLWSDMQRHLQDILQGYSASRTNRKIEYSQLASKIEEFNAKKEVDDRSLEEVFQFAVDRTEPSQRDMARLATFSSEAWIDYLTLRPRKNVTSALRYVHYSSERISGPEGEKVKSIVLEVASQLAKSFALNKERMKAMELVNEAGND